MTKKTKKCRGCLEPIKLEASVCKHCGARQGKLAHLALSSTIISLLVALLSLILLVADRVADMWLYDANISASIVEISPDTLVLSVANTGKGDAVIIADATCTVVPSKAEYIIFEGKKVGVRVLSDPMSYPRKAHFDGVYWYNFKLSNENMKIVKAGEVEGLTFLFNELGYRNTLPEALNIILPPPATNSRRAWKQYSLDREITPEDELPSYCLVRYQHENGKRSFLPLSISPMDVNSFGILNPEVQKKLKDKKPLEEGLIKILKQVKGLE